MKYQPLKFEKPIVELQDELGKLQKQAAKQKIDLSAEIAAMEKKIQNTRTEIYQKLTPWQRVQIARHTQRPFMLDYLQLAFDDFLELHGDRHVGDDSAMLGGFAMLGSQRCVVVGHQKGRDTKENLKRNFGSAHPEGYRKSLRLMQIAEKFKLPVIALIDTPGAFPGIGAEERNIAEAIAFNLREMMLIRVPIIAVVLGEGGVGRSPRDRNCKSRLDDGERVLFGDFARRLCRDSLETSEIRSRSSGGDEDHGSGSTRARPH